MGEIIATQILMRREELIERNLKISRENLKTLESWIKNNAYMEMTAPKAGFTGFPSYTHNISSETPCEELLREKGVLISPGLFFGLDHHLRINTGSNNQTLKEGL